MKKVLNLHNINLFLIVTILSIFSIIDVNATVTWDNNTSSVTITRSVTGVTIPVTNTFGYTVTADANNSTGATGAPTTGSVVMSAQAVSGTTATKTGSIDFSGMSFTEPGHYKYVITETSSTDDTRYPVDSTHTYTVEVVAHNASTSNPNGTDYTAYLIVWNDATPPAKADANFTSASPTNQYGHIELSKTVTGSAADASMYFRLGTRIWTPGSFTVTGFDASATCGSTTNPSSATGSITGSDSPSYKYFCVKTGQTLTIGVKNSLNQIPAGIRIDITEPSYTTDGYTTSYVFNGGSSVSSRSKTNWNMLSGTVTMAYTNTKNETVDTGILINLIPYIILIAIVTIGIIVFIRFKRRKPYEEKN